MTVFIDTNVIIYSAVLSNYRSNCLNLLKSIASGNITGRISTAVLEEVWHLELSGKVGNLNGLTEHAYKLFSPLLPVTDEVFQSALKQSETGLGANDRLHLSVCVHENIGTIVSADSDFDGVDGIERIDPLDTDAITHLTDK